MVDANDLKQKKIDRIYKEGNSDKLGLLTQWRCF